jgi:alkylation response protein AidB-like acyl-CoA dehydrogenase
MSIAASCTGIIQACLDSMIEYTTQREQFGKKIAAHQLVQELLADTAVLLDASRLMYLRAADLKHRGEDYALASSKAKLFATRASVTAANNCVQAYGGYGYIDEYPAGKYPARRPGYHAVRGTSQVQKLIIGAGPHRHLCFLSSDGV